MSRAINIIKSIFLVVFVNIFFITSASATVITFNFSGRLTVLDPTGSIITDPQSAGIFPGDTLGAQTPINSSLTIDTASGLGSAGLFIAPFSFFAGSPDPNTSFRSISLQQVSGTNYLIGNMLADYNANTGIPVSMVWDASGLFGAIDLAPGGLQVGDVISGDILKRGGTTIVNSVGSALPASEGMVATDGQDFVTLNQGFAPLAMTNFNTSTLCTPGVNCFENPLTGGEPLSSDGLPGSPIIDGVFAGIGVNFDIGSGNSMTVTSTVPVPPSLWLFGTGLIGLISFFKKRK